MIEVVNLEATILKIFLQFVEKQTVLLKLELTSLKKSLNWAVKIHNPHHNKNPSLHPAAHSMHRRLSTQQIETLQNLRINGVNPKEAVSYLHQQIPDCLASRDTIYNANNKHRRNILAGRKPIEVLIEYCKQENFSVTSNSTQDG